MDKHEITWDDDAQGLRPPTSIEFCFDFNDSEGLGVSTSELSCSGHWRTSPDHRLWWIGASNDHGFYMFLGWELYWVLLNPMTQANMVSTGEPITQSVTHRESDRIADAADAGSLEILADVVNQEAWEPRLDGHKRPFRGAPTWIRRKFRSSIWGPITGWNPSEKSWS